MANRLQLIMALAVLVAGTAEAGAPSPGDALAEVGRIAAEAGYAAEVRTELMAKAREALEQGVLPQDVAALVRTGAGRNTEGDQIARYLALAAETKRAGLPEGPVLNRIHQGIAKGAPADKVLLVAGQVKANLTAAGSLVDRAAAQGLASGGQEERSRAIRAAALAIETGFAAGDLEKIGGLAAREELAMRQFARALEAMTNLRETGMPMDLAVQTARRFVILGYSEKGMAREEINLLRMHESGASWGDAFRQFQSEYERGPRREGPPAHLPGMTPGPGAGGRMGR